MGCHKHNFQQIKKINATKPSLHILELMKYK